MLQLVIDAVSDAVVVVNTTGTMELSNTCAARLFGYPGGDLPGKPIRILFPSDDPAARPIASLLEDARDRGCVETQIWQRRADASRFLTNLVVRSVPEGEGRGARYVLVSRDLTDRRRASDERSQEDTKFRVLVESVRDYAIFMLDPTGHVATWNEGAQRIKGYAADEIIGQHFSVFYRRGESAPASASASSRSRSREGRFEDEGWRLRKDGTQFWANVVITPLRDESGELHRLREGHARSHRAARRRARSPARSQPRRRFACATSSCRWPRTS